MKLKRTAALLLTLCSVGLAQATTLIRSDFDTSAQGWTAGNGVRDRSWVEAGGDPGGYIRATDNGAEQIWAFSAPPAWLSALSGAYGGSLSWSLKTSTLAVPMALPYADVKIGGAGLVLAADAGPPPGLDWTRYTIDFTPGTWTLGDLQGPLATAAQIAQVMAAAEFLHLRGEFSGWIDTGSLDTVVLSAVPELPSATLALAGLALLAWRRRRAAD